MTGRTPPEKITHALSKRVAIFKLWAVCQFETG
jgi:hypothetical protein